MNLGKVGVHYQTEIHTLYRNQKRVTKLFVITHLGKLVYVIKLEFILYFKGIPVSKEYLSYL